MNALVARRMAAVALSALVASAMMAPKASATIWTLTDLNSTVQVDDSSQAGVFNWTIDGQNQLYQQWFWYRVGATGPEAPINALPLTFSSFNPLDPTSLKLRYSDAAVSIQVTYSLTGASLGSFSSDLTEAILIRNLSGSPLDFHFFQYSDFDLCGPGGDTVTIANGNKVTQTAPGCVLSETVLTPAASRWEANSFANTLNKLNDGAPTTLNNQLTYGPGDATWAYQWDKTVAPGGSFSIGKAKSIDPPVPEPGTLLLLGSGVSALVLRRRRKV